MNWKAGTRLTVRVQLGEYPKRVASVSMMDDTRNAAAKNKKIEKD
jgi:hypothetical protein